MAAEGSDLALIERCRRGEHAAAAELIARFQKPVFRVAYRVLGDQDEANDVAQTTFLKVFENIARFDPSHKLFSWIYRIAINEALDQLQRGRRHVALEDEWAAAGDGPEELTGSDRISRRVQAALMELSEDYRVVLVLRHFSECSYEQIAGILSIPEKTVKSRIYSARQQLKDRLLADGIDLA